MQSKWNGCQSGHTIPKPNVIVQYSDGIQKLDHLGTQLIFTIPHKSLAEDVNNGPLNNILLLVLNLSSPSFDKCSHLNNNILVCYSGHG